MADDKCTACDTDSCAAQEQQGDESLEQFLERQELTKTLCQIKHKILVLSGKGGVGKSTVAANMAVALALDGKRVGLLDIDIHGPSIPKLLKLEGRTLDTEGGKLVPTGYGDNLKVVSIGFMLPNDDDPVIWRGPLKMGVIKQFVKDVLWGELDYLVVDSPPGTGDEPLSICQLIPDADGAVVVTTPQDVAVVDVRKCVSFCRKLNMRVLGVVENMSGLVCPHCQERIDVFKTGGGQRMAQEMEVPFLGGIPLDPMLVQASDDGTPFTHRYGHSETAKDMLRVVRKVQSSIDQSPAPPALRSSSKENDTMKIAIPTAEGKLCMHFGHCDTFAFLEVDTDAKKILSKEMLQPPPHEPGVLPRWLNEQGANLVVAGGMGARAQGFFQEFGIDVMVGAPSDEPENVVSALLDGTLQLGKNICDH